ncbi:hypothetical protein C9994_09730 [Marivirga lumbricoides]|uniref:DUF6989 domain-containing protein n=1 Tax=Marivirga lumbricoides TaxID=1046115 RepID=A0A2T4DQ07_9BACT|nr:hypothetical protein C9994_09730 [Marivirga lumbricoides]
MALTNQIDGLNKKTTKTIIVSAIVLMGWSCFSAITAAGPWSAFFITFLLYIFFWCYALYFKNPLLLRLTIIATIAGILELVTDFYLVETINSLNYPQNEMMLWASPAYMPFAWSNVLVQLSFIGVLLTNRLGVLKASIILCIAGGMYIPIYEHLANNAGWWNYNPDTTMIFNAPLYVIVCEAFISLSLPAIMNYSEHHKLLKSIVLGILLGFWILLSAYIAVSFFL